MMVARIHLKFDADEGRHDFGWVYSMPRKPTWSFGPVYTQTRTPSLAVIAPTVRPPAIQ